MKIWQFVVPGLLGLALAGCHSDPAIAYLERDNLKKEQEIDRLRNRIEDLEEALNAVGGHPASPAACRREKCRPNPAQRNVESGRRHPPRSAFHAARTHQSRARNAPAGRT